MEFKKGDIVKWKNIVAVEYFVVEDVLDLSLEEDEQPYIEYEIAQIFPVKKDMKTDVVHPEHLELVAKEEDGTHYQNIIDFVKRERERKGWFDTPKKPPVKKPKEIKVKFGEKEIKKILSDTKADKQLDAYLGKMDMHLKLLHKAIEKDDMNAIDLHKQKLEEIRQKLMELEYFQMEERIKGLSTKIK